MKKSASKSGKANGRDARSTPRKAAAKKTPRQRAPKLIARARKEPRAKAAPVTAAQAAKATDAARLSLPREAFVAMALDSVRSGDRKGVKMTALKLPEELLFEAACRTLLTHDSEKDIIADLAPELKKRKISDGAMRTWFQRVRREYWRMTQERAREWGKFDALLRQLDGDLGNRANVLFDAVAVQMLEHVRDDTILDDDPKMVQARARMLETILRARQVQSDSELSRAKVAQIEATLAKLTEKSGETSTKGDVADMARALLTALGRPALASEIEGAAS